MTLSDIDELETQIPRGAEPPPEASPFFEERKQVEQELGITHDEALTRVTTRFSDARRYRRGRELTWYLCLAFYLDDHYAHLDRNRTSIVSGYMDKVPKYRVRAMNNKITPAADELVARLVRSRPTLTASPATADPMDVDGALVGTSVLHHEWKRLELTELDHELRLWTVLTGTAGVWTRWNQALGPLTKDEEGYAGPPQGEIETVLVSPFEMYPDPFGNSYSNMQYMIHAVEEDVEGLQAAYPDLAKKIGPDNLRLGHGREYEDRLSALMGASLGMPHERARFGNSATLMHYWEPRSQRFPDGLMVIATSSAVLWMGENPWAHWGGTANGWCPIDIFRYRSLKRKCFWGKGAVESAISLQKKLNRVLSQILENANEATNSPWLIPRGCKLNAKKATFGPGERIWVSPPPLDKTAGGRFYKPERLDAPQIPTTLFKLIMDLKAEIEDIFGYHQVSKGGAPPGVRSGVAIEQLQEKDETQSGPVSDRQAKRWARVGHRVLTLAHDEWEDERFIEIHGDEGLSELQAFKGADLPANLHVTVDTDSMLPTNRWARIKALYDLREIGVLTPMEVREAIFGGWGTIRATLARANADQRKQRRENRRMMSGTPAEVDNFDNHVLHLMELNTFRKSPTFERIRNNSVMLKDPNGQPLGMTTIGWIFEVHAVGHARAIKANPLMAMGATGQEGAEEPGAEEGEPETANAGTGVGALGAPDSGGK